MRTKTPFASLPLCILAFCLILGAIMPYAVADDDESAQVLRHVVLLKFKDDATAEQVRAIEAAFCRLPSATGVIMDMEWGTNVSPENLDQGYTHLFFLTFKNEADRDAYLPHPAHKEFGAMLGPVLDKVAVFDYWTKP
ncbi:MAG: Dabb family protein [Candidatus Hydrogenedentes bacterium]|nr:Dabb family protein [Candidatus Hydrogenedentota bacterium]